MFTIASRHDDDVADDSSAPLGGVTVWFNGRYKATTDASGHFTLDGVLDLGGLDGYNVAWTEVTGTITWRFAFGEPPGSLMAGQVS